MKRATTRGIGTVCLALTSAHFGCAAASLAGPSAHRAPPADVAGIRWGANRAAADDMPEVPDLRREITAPPTALKEELEAVVATPPPPTDVEPVPIAVLVDQNRKREIERVKSTPQRIHAPTRTRTEQATAVDYASIALATTVRPEPYAKGAAFNLMRIDRTPAVCPAGLIPRQKITWFMPRFSSAPTVMRLGAKMIPPMDVLDGTYEDFGLAQLAERPAHATWTSLERTGDVAEVTEFAGTFRPDTKQGEATLKTAASASALSKGVLYAFRKCNAGCGEPLGSSFRDEELFVLGPPAFWVGSSDDPESQTVSYDQPFSLVSARLRPGTSASLTLVALKQDVDDFRERRRRVDPVLGNVADEWLTFTVDVVWPRPGDSGEATTPEVNLFTGSGRGNARKLAGGDIRYTHAGDLPGCSSSQIDFLDPVF